MEILIAGIVGIIIWQVITLLAFVVSGESDDVGISMGMGLPLILTQLIVALIHKIKWLFFRRKYRHYHFKDATLESYSQLRTDKYAKPADMQCFNFDPSADHYVVEKVVSNKYRYVPHSDILTKQDIQFCFAGIPADYLNRFKKN